MNRTIWSSDCKIEDWNDFFDECYPDRDEDDRIRLMYELNADYLDDERANLSFELPEEIIVIADLGLWYGRRSGYKLLKSRKISDCLYSDCDYNEWFVDQYKNLRCRAAHHDGTNYYLYRMWKPGLSDEQKENFLFKIYEGKATAKDMTRYTKRIGDYIGRIYGWCA